MDGYAGTILYVDLTTGTLEPRLYPEDLQQQYFGGRGTVVDGVEGEGSEYEQTRSLGADCGIDDLTWNLQKVFNLKSGLTKADDTLPPRLLHEPLQEGAPKGRVWERESMLDQYYAVRDWDSEGRPTPQTLQRLGI